MRFAWLRTKEDRDPPVATAGERLVTIAYNAVWWVPLGLVLLDLVSDRAGFLAFLAITVGRGLINSYRVNLMPVAAAERFPLRQPGA